MRTNDQGRGVEALDEATVAAMLDVAGFAVAPEKLPLVIERLHDIYRLAATLDEIDLDGIAPASDFDPHWSAGEGAG